VDFPAQGESRLRGVKGKESLAREIQINQEEKENSERALPCSEGSRCEKSLTKTGRVGSIDSERFFGSSYRPHSQTDYQTTEVEVEAGDKDAGDKPWFAQKKGGGQI